jgi:hypothetical protein
MPGSDSGRRGKRLGLSDPEAGQVRVTAAGVTPLEYTERRSTDIGRVDLLHSSA